MLSTLTLGIGISKRAVAMLRATASAVQLNLYDDLHDWPLCQSVIMVETSSDNLLFLLTYLKGNQLQEFQAAPYGLSQAKVSRLIHLLRVLLDETLHKMGPSPARDSEGLTRQLKAHPDTSFNHDVRSDPLSEKPTTTLRKRTIQANRKTTPVRMNWSATLLARCCI